MSRAVSDGVAEQTRAVLRAATDAYLLLDDDRVILELSDGYARASGMAREDLIGRRLMDLFLDDAASAERLRASLAEVRLHGAARDAALLRLPSVTPQGSIGSRAWRTLATPVADSSWILLRVEDVTPVHLHDDALATAASLSRHYANLFEHAPDAVLVVDSQGIVRHANARAEALFGYDRTELVERSMELLIPERMRRAHDAHVLAYFQRPYARPMGSGLQLFGRRKDGVELPLEVCLSPLPGERGSAVVVSIRDVTERRALEAAAALTSDRLRSAVESMLDAFALFDHEQRLVMCNSTYRALLGTRIHGSPIGMPYAQLLDAWLDAVAFPDEAAREAYRASRLENQARAQPGVVDVTLVDGRHIRIIDRRTPEAGIVRTVVDRSDDERLARELRDAREVAEAASTAKSEFVSSMSHELRTPLNSILGFAQLLERDRREPLSDRHRERVAHILRGGEHLLRLIDDILDLARIETGRTSIDLAPVEVGELLAEIVRSLEPLAARTSVALALDAPAGLPRVRADRTRLAQIAMNLGSNAIKYNRPGGRVRFTASRTGEVLRIAVADTGHGIPLEDQARLFQPFQRGSQEAGPIEGTGIGLVITKRLAELMGGGVGFRSTPGEGSTFWVDLALEPTRAPSAVMPMPEGGHHLLLYIEDDPTNVSVLRELLSTLDGLELAVAASAEVGIEIARARHPAMIITDLNLPGMSGLEALRVLREDPRTANVPVIALTAAAGSRKQGLELGFARYLTKPADLGELREAIASLLPAH